MQAFISYSHEDASMLDLLHKHLAQLQRDNIVTAWTDRDILAGGKLNAAISSELSQSNLFFALLSPHYIASNYCYETEFQKALEMEKLGSIIIVPIIIEPCDWQHTPFKEFKALPKDGKAVSTWENKNTAFLDVIQNIRKLLTSNTGKSKEIKSSSSNALPFSRNYRVKKDFDSIEKLEFTEKTFTEIKEYLKRYIEEILQIENIKARTLIETDKQFECWLVNRNKIDSESQLKISIDSGRSHSGFRATSENQIIYSITHNSRPSNVTFLLSFDEFEMFWSQGSFYSSQSGTKLKAKDISEMIWNEWLESVGIL